MTDSGAQRVLITKQGHRAWTGWWTHGLCTPLPGCESRPCTTFAVNILFKKKSSKTKMWVPKTGELGIGKKERGCPVIPRQQNFPLINTHWVPSMSSEGERFFREYPWKSKLQFFHQGSCEPRLEGRNWCQRHLSTARSTPSPELDALRVTPSSLCPLPVPQQRQVAYPFRTSVSSGARRKKGQTHETVKIKSNTIKVLCMV